MDQSIKNGVIGQVFIENVVVSAGDWIKSSLFKLFVDKVVAHVKGNEYAWLLVELLEHVDLFYGSGGTQENPTVGLAILHIKSLSQKFHYDIIWDGLAVLNDLPQLKGVNPLSPDAILHHLVDVDVNQLVLRRNFFGVLIQLDPWWSHHDDLWWLSWGVGIFEHHNSCHFFNNLSFALVSVDFIDAAHELSFDTFNVESVLSDRVLSDLIQFILIVELG